MLKQIDKYELPDSEEIQLQKFQRQYPIMQKSFVENSYKLGWMKGKVFAANKMIEMVKNGKLKKEVLAEILNEILPKPEGKKWAKK